MQECRRHGKAIQFRKLIRIVINIRVKVDQSTLAKLKINTVSAGQFQKVPELVTILNGPRMVAPYFLNIRMVGIHLGSRFEVSRHVFQPIAVVKVA